MDVPKVTKTGDMKALCSGDGKRKMKCGM